MSQLKIGINGFGRIGRSAFKVAFERSDVKIVAINDLVDVKSMAYVLKHDSNYGTYHNDVKYGEDEIIVASEHIKVLSEVSPETIPWGDLGVDVVIESTGKFTSREMAEQHLSSGAKKVIIGNPIAGDNIETIIMGVNDDEFKNDSSIISCATPTSNSIGALMSILDGEFGIQKSLLTTIHSYTSSQTLTDRPFRDLREGRNAAENIVPSTTGATKKIMKILPQLDDKFDGLSLRVPTPIVSLCDLTVLLGRKTSVKELNEVIKSASQEPFYQGILGVSDEPLVSRDYVGDSRSGIVDLLLTRVVDDNLVKIMVWYDNEWGYCNRLVEMAVDAGRSLKK